MWNVHEATLEGSARTNNVCEGWNNKFANLIGHNHPSIWKCIEGFQKDHSLVETTIEQDLIGNAPKIKIKKGAAQLQKRLQHLCKEKAEGRRTITDFLEGVGHNIHLNRLLD